MALSAPRAVRDAGLELSGYCRGGMFTSDGARRGECETTTGARG